MGHALKLLDGGWHVAAESAADFGLRHFGRCGESFLGDSLFEELDTQSLDYPLSAFSVDHDGEVTHCARNSANDGHPRRVGFGHPKMKSPAQRLPRPVCGCSLGDMSNVNPLVAPDSTRQDVASAVRAHLAVRKISDSALGRAIGMSQSKISRRTNGDIAFDTDDLGRIARYLGVTVVELIQMPVGSPEPKRPLSD